MPPDTNASTKATKCIVTATPAIGRVALDKISRRRSKATRAYSMLKPYKPTAMRSQKRDMEVVLSSSPARFDGPRFYRSYCELGRRTVRQLYAALLGLVCLMLVQLLDDRDIPADSLPPADRSTPYQTSPENKCRPSAALAAPFRERAGN